MEEDDRGDLSWDTCGHLKSWSCLFCVRKGLSWTAPPVENHWVQLESSRVTGVCCADASFDLGMMSTGLALGRVGVSSAGLRLVPWGGKIQEMFMESQLGTCFCILKSISQLISQNKPRLNQVDSIICIKEPWQMCNSLQREGLETANHPSS